jgi:hypothetical protein
VVRLKPLVMVSQLTRKLLQLAAAIAPDGGVGAARRLLEALSAPAPPDAGGIIFVRGGGIEHLSLISSINGLVERDALDHALDQDRIVRLDDLPDANRFPRTQALMRDSGLRSLLVIPIPMSSSERAAAVLASSTLCAFAGVSTGTIDSLRLMAGLALRASLRMNERHESPTTEQPPSAEPWDTDYSDDAAIEETTAASASEAAPTAAPDAALPSTTKENQTQAQSSRSRRRRRFRFRPPPG